MVCSGGTQGSHSECSWPPPLPWLWAHLSLPWLSRTLLPPDLHLATGRLQTSPSPCDLLSNSSPPFFLQPSQMFLHNGKGNPKPTTASWPGPAAVTREGWRVHQKDRGLRQGASWDIMAKPGKMQAYIWLIWTCWKALPKTTGWQCSLLIVCHLQGCFSSRLPARGLCCHKTTHSKHNVDRNGLHKAAHTHVAMQVCVQQHHGTRETVNSICRKRHKQSHANPCLAF